MDRRNIETMSPLGVPVAQAAAISADGVLAALEAGPDGLTDSQASDRLRRGGPNAVAVHHTRAAQVLLRQLRSPLLVLLLTAAAISFTVGEHTDGIIIGVILTLSIGLGFMNEYRAERAAAALHDRLQHSVTVLRDRRPVTIAVTGLVPGDIVRLTLGQMVPADVRLLEVQGLECDESMLTGESLPVAKHLAPVPESASLAELASCALMGTVVARGSATAVVVATGGAAEFGRLALELGQDEPESAFQAGLRRFSSLLLWVAGVLTVAVFAINLLLGRPLLDALLFSLAIAVGITPQLLPAIVTTSLAAGTRRLAARNVLVKRLVSIEDLGDIDILLTDKTGTLTRGDIRLTAALSPDGSPSDRTLALGLACTDLRTRGSDNPLDTALWQADDADQLTSEMHAVATLPFDHDRRMASTLTDTPDGRLLICKGAPETVLNRCADPPATARDVLEQHFASGARVIAVATRPAPGDTILTASDESGLTLAGFLLFADPPKPDAANALRRLADLGITVKVATGDNASVAVTVCTELGIPADAVLTGNDIDNLDDSALITAANTTTVFARVSPEQKARVIRALRTHGQAVAFLGDGVNDAIALHAADVGISVDTAIDVARDAADVILLEKNLNVLADGVTEGRRIFANTIKYVLMGTSSNFGNMFSAAGASAFLPFLPMLPSQILLNNLLYDASQLAISTDRVDPEQVAAPSHWDIRLIRRFMLIFGPISSLFDFLTFAVMLTVFHAGAGLFQTGWFVESLATQTLVIFVIRTRRSPFWRSRPSLPLTAAALGVVGIGAALPATPLGTLLGFQPLPVGYFAALAAMVVVYLALVEGGKRWFYATLPEPAAPVRTRDRSHRVRRRARHFTQHTARRTRRRIANQDSRFPTH